MDKTKLIFTASLLVTLSFGLQAQDFSVAWGRFPMDGHRTSDGNLSASAAKESRIIENYSSRMDDIFKAIGQCDVRMASYAPQSPLSNWIADALRFEAGKMYGSPCDVSLINLGGIREVMQPGDVRMFDVLNILPFKIYPVVLKIRGNNLRALFEGMANSGWQAFSGVEVSVDGTEIRSIKVGGEALQDDKIYSLASVSFLLNGGDNFHLLDISEDCIKFEGKYIADVIAEHIRQLTSEGKHIYSKIDNRISVTGQGPVKLDFPPRKRSDKEIAAVHGRLSILHSNDTHSHIEPICNENGGRIGGIVERAAFVDSVRKADGRRNVLLVDAGDFSQGSPYFSLFAGEVEVSAMNAMKYDVATLGNHEFDNGLTGLKKCLKKASFKTVLCNYEFPDKYLSRRLKDYVILHRGGLKIGFIGALADITSLVDKSSGVDIQYCDPVEPVNRIAAMLKEKQHCDVVVLLSHCGTSSKDTKANRTMDLGMAPLLHNVDIIVGGHTHTDLNEEIRVKDADGKQVVIVTSYRFGTVMGELKLF